MKPNPPAAMKQFGQTSLPSCFLSKSNSSTPDVVASGAKTNKKQPISLSDFLSRKLGKTDGRSVQEKQSSFSSIGFGKKDEELGRSGDVLDTAVFRGFKRPASEEENGDAGGVGEEEFLSDSTWVCRGSRKRKNPFGVYSGDVERPSASEYSVVGNGLKPIVPQPQRRAKKPMVEKARPFYNHYESGSGWWDCDREGVDSEEVGCNEVWEGMGTTTLGGLEWH